MTSRTSIYTLHWVQKCEDKFTAAKRNIASTVF